LEPGESALTGLRTGQSFLSRGFEEVAEILHAPRVGAPLDLNLEGPVLEIGGDVLLGCRLYLDAVAGAAAHDEIERHPG
jgi:hypothetical protein